MTPTEQELFEERAAIMEFDGGRATGWSLTLNTAM